MTRGIWRPVRPSYRYRAPYHRIERIMRDYPDCYDREPVWRGWWKRFGLPVLEWGMVPALLLLLAACGSEPVAPEPSCIESQSGTIEHPDGSVTSSATICNDDES